ncbi:MAG: hypothetical protein [Circoviridae sp.]|nr:MAG: hypothetical protein [Circoviridae sp.]
MKCSNVTVCGTSPLELAIDWSNTNSRAFGIGITYRLSTISNISIKRSRGNKTIAIKGALCLSINKIGLSVTSKTCRSKVLSIITSNPNINTGSRTINYSRIWIFKVIHTLKQWGSHTRKPKRHDIRVFI